MIRKGIGIVLLIMCFLGCVGGGLSDAASAVPFIILGGIGICLILKKGKSKEQKQEIKQKREAQKEYNKTHISLTHVAGLPIAEGTNCSCGLEGEGFVFSSAGNDFNLKFDKITSVDIKTNVEIQKQYVSSVGGAVGGAVLFGPLGAIVGGRAKQKQHREVSYFLIITYLKDGEVSYISFEIPSMSVNKARELKKSFDAEYKQNVSAKIEL